MDAEQFHKKWGYITNACDKGPNYNPEACADWKGLADPQKELLKQNAPFYQGPGGQEQAATGEWWEKYQAGPDTNIWRGLSEMLGFKPGAIKEFAMGKFRELMERPDFAEEYGLSKKALHQQLMEAERDIAGKFSARGLLDSSAHAQAVGGAMGGYTQGLADLMLGKAGMEEGAYQGRMNIGGNLLTQGMNFADFLNTQYLQEMGLGAEAINYLAGERARKHEFEMQRYGINPNINDPITGLEGVGMGLNALASVYSAAQGGGYSFDWDSSDEDEEGSAFGGTWPPSW